MTPNARRRFDPTGCSTALLPPQLLFLLFTTAAVASSSSAAAVDASPSAAAASAHYTNQFAVRVAGFTGGGSDDDVHARADALARKHGFVNRGQVSRRRRTVLPAPVLVSGTDSEPPQDDDGFSGPTIFFFFSRHFSTGFIEKYRFRSTKKGRVVGFTKFISFSLSVRKHFSVKRLCPKVTFHPFVDKRSCPVVHFKISIFSMFSKVFFRVVEITTENSSENGKICANEIFILYVLVI